MFYWNHKHTVPAPASHCLFHWAPLSPAQPAHRSCAMTHFTYHFPLFMVNYHETFVLEAFMVGIWSSLGRNTTYTYWVSFCSFHISPRQLELCSLWTTQPKPHMFNMSFWSLGSTHKKKCRKCFCFKVIIKMKIQNKKESHREPVGPRMSEVGKHKPNYFFICTLQDSAQ